MLEDHIKAKQRRDEYEICMRRGHQPSNTVLTSYPPKNVCKWCGTHYYRADRIHESNVPSEIDQHAGVSDL